MPLAAELGFAALEGGVEIRDDSGKLVTRTLQTRR